MTASIQEETYTKPLKKYALSRKVQEPKRETSSKFQCGSSAYKHALLSKLSNSKMRHTSIELAPYVFAFGPYCLEPSLSKNIFKKHCEKF